VSDTIPTVVFSPHEIIRCDEARADLVKVWRVDIARSDEKKRHTNAPTSKAPVMNDVSKSIHGVSVNVNRSRGAHGYPNLLRLQLLTGSVWITLRPYTRGV